MRRFIGKVSSVLVALLVVAGGNAQALGTMNYVLDTNGKTKIPTPVTYQVITTYSYFGEQGGVLTKPSDIFVDADDNLYIADTGNNRIVKLDKDGHFVSSFTDSNRLNAPEGVYVDKNGDIYVADTLNERIVHLDQDDNYIEEFVKPKSDMLEESMDFQVSRLGLSQQGYLYMLKGQNFMTIDANNEFKGYVGANELGFSLVRTLIRVFASQEQQSKFLKEEPPAYNSFDIGDDGMVYATTVETKSNGQIRKINAVGENIYPIKAYGEKYYNEQTKVYNNPRFVDISVSASGIVYVLEQYSSQIYAYDQEGNLLTVFGGEGKIQGRFEVAQALDINSAGNIFVLDSSTGFIHRFAQTEFMDNVVDAVTAYDVGQYENAYTIWNKVLQIDVNYPVANRGIAQALYKAGNVDKAMEYYKLAVDKNGYGTAFSEFRYRTFRSNFGWIVLIIGIAVFGCILLIRWLKRRSNRLVKDYFGGGDGK